MKPRLVIVGIVLVRTVRSLLAAETVGTIQTEVTADEKYKGEDRGLYGGGKNEPPKAHRKVALAESVQIVRLDEDGNCRSFEPW